MSSNHTFAAGLVLSLVVSGCSKTQAETTGTEPTDKETADTKETERRDARAGSDWPAFLGPDGNGISSETGLLKTWPAEGPPVAWTKEIGTGYSAPSVIGRKLVVFHRIGGEEVIECLDAVTGEAVWRESYRSSFRDPYGYNNGPRCAPLLTSEFCYTFGAEGVLRCSRLSDGSEVWTCKTQDRFNVPEAFFGVGSTPILVDGVLVAPVGGQENAGLVGFDPETGETLWQSVGRETWDGVATGWRREPNYEWSGDEMVMSYSSPIAATFHGQTHVLCLTRHGLVSVNPKTGEENFHLWFRSEKHESVNASRPVVVDDTIMISSTYGVGAACLRVKPDGKSFEEIWRTSDTFETHWSTATYVDGHYYGFTSRHERDALMVCVDAATGEVKWSTTGWDEPVENLRMNGRGDAVDSTTGEVIAWPFYGRGSATFADGSLFVLGERGTLACVEADATGWKETARSAAPEVSYPSWPAPVLSRGLLYLRDEDSLVALDLRARADSGE